MSSYHKKEDVPKYARPLSPNFYEAHFYLGRCYSKVWLFEKAIEQFNVIPSFHKLRPRARQEIKKATDMLKMIDEMQNE